MPAKKKDTKKTEDSKKTKTAVKATDKKVKKTATKPSSTSGDDKVILVTKDGLKKLQEELKDLKEVKRKEVAERIKEAISYGDLSENSEYDEAKNEQAFVEGRILELEDKIKYAKIISEHHKTKNVQIGSHVELKNLSKKGETEKYTIVGSTEADPFECRISNESPVGSAVLSKSKGEKFTVDVPAGQIEYEVVKID